MVKTKTLMLLGRVVLLLGLSAYPSFMAPASTISTPFGSLAASVAAKIESYSKQHDGTLPPDLDGLFDEFNRALLDNQFGGPISSKISYLKTPVACLDDANSEIIAVSSLPIDEKLRASVGRYIIYRRKTSEVGSRWEGEEMLHHTFTNGHATLPHAQSEVCPLYADPFLSLPSALAVVVIFAAFGGWFLFQRSFQMDGVPIKGGRCLNSTLD